MRPSFKLPSAASFAAIILVFFLPFVDVRCGSTSLSKITGLELATGYRVEVMDDNSLGGQLKDLDKSQSKNSNDVNYYMLAAFALSILGVIASLWIKKRMMVIVIGWLGLIALVAFYIDVKRQVNEALSTNTDATDPISKQLDQAAITVHFEPGYYIAAILFILAAAFAMRRQNAK